MALTPKQRRAALARGLSVDLSPDKTKYTNANPDAALRLFRDPVSRHDPQSSSVQQPLSGGQELPADRLPRQTVDRKDYRQTVSPDYRQTVSPEGGSNAAPLPADRKTDVEPQTVQQGIPLAPVQWLVYEALLAADSAGTLVSYRKLAQAANASIRGVRDALAVIEKEGGIQAKTTVRTADEQGMRIMVNRTVPFTKASVSKTKGLARRGASYRQTVDRKTIGLPADRLSTSVCSNINIKQTDIADLLRMTPANWQLRERTLIEIAEALPAMTALEFRRSLMHLVAQANRSRTEIRDYNAWTKAAFLRTNGPLVTERMIEAQIDQVTKTAQGKREPGGDDDIRSDFAVLRRYLAANAEDRAAIDMAAAQRAAQALRIASAEQHAGIIEQARIECAREFFARQREKT